jgi:hypothetical protein
MMSLAKALPDSLKDGKCKKIALRKCPLIPYTPKKDCVQGTVLSFKDNNLRHRLAAVRIFEFLSATL